jgi:hypothetical protein
MRSISIKSPTSRDGSIYIFPGEKFGVIVSTAGDEIAGVGYVKEASKGDVRLEFRQEKAGGGRVMMILVIESKLKRTLYMDASMQLPNRKGVYKANIYPCSRVRVDLRAGLTQLRFLS